jgi:hypothetical protein
VCKFFFGVVLGSYVGVNVLDLELVVVVLAMKFVVVDDEELVELVDIAHNLAKWLLFLSLFTCNFDKLSVSILFMSFIVSVRASAMSLSSECNCKM